MIADVDNKYTCIAEATPDNSQPYKWLPSCDIDGSYKPVQCKERGSDPRYFENTPSLKFYELYINLLCLRHAVVSVTARQGLAFLASTGWKTKTK